MLSAGWAPTVGVVGWAIGDSHGPFAPALGLGVVNIFEEEIITADNQLLTVNSAHHADLYWALRGGGGGNWGVISAITYRAHKIPQGCVTELTIKSNGNMCSDN